MTDFEGISNEFLELSSEQRLSILLNLTKERTNLSSMAKRLDATAAEIHRNLSRLQKSGLVKKNPDGTYELTLYGKTICSQIPTLEFMTRNKKYFENHDFSYLPSKYVQRIGALAESEIIVGYVKVAERCEDIYRNSRQYICNILIEIPYNERLLQILESKLNQKVKISSIFSETAIISKDRKELLAKFNFSKFTKDGSLERRMYKDTKIAVAMNESEAGLSFPTENGEPDVSKMFYSSEPSFHEWCYDFFNDCWKSSTSFQESKLVSHQP